MQSSLLGSRRGQANPLPLSLGLGLPEATLEVSSGSPPGEPANISVRAATDIPGNVYVGPYCGDLLLGINRADQGRHTYSLRVKYGQETILLESDRERSVPFWLVYVQASRDRQEQNTEALRDSRGLVFYRTMRDVAKGEELLAWYSEDLAREIALPVLTPANIRGQQQYTCTKCLKTYRYPNTLKAHMRFHCTATLSAGSRLGMYLPSGILPAVPSAAMGGITRTQSSSSSGSFPSMTKSISDISRGESSVRDKAVRELFKHGASSAFSPHRKSHLEKEADRRSPFSSPDPPRSTSSSPRVSGTECSSRQATETSEKKEKTGCFSFRPYDLPNKPAKSIPQPAVSLALPAAAHSPAFRYLPPWYPHLYSSSNPTYPAVSFLGAAAGSSLFNTSAAIYAQSLHKMSLPVSPEVSTSHESHGHSLLDTRDNSRGLETSPQVPASAFNFPMLSDKAGEPLDLLPRSLYMSKSRKGHLCVYCGKLYSRKYGLKIHLRTHTGYKPLKCKVCLRPFGDPSNLNKHIRLHAEGDTPYRCEYCGKVLVRRRDLERHIRSRHPSLAGKLDESHDDDELHDEQEKPSDDEDDELNEVDSCGESMDDMDCKEEIEVV